MRRPILLTLSLTLATAGPLVAGTFDRSRIAPDLGLDVLDRHVAREQVGRELFADPYATVTIGHLDVYDVFPYLESRTFEIVSDPRWNRLVYGETGRSLRAFDGRGTTAGALAGPRGLAADEHDRVYVADTDNNRILVLQASSEFGELTLQPVYTIDGLSGPYAAAYSDGGTPFQPGDDLLYVADTGRNRVVAYALEPTRARMVASIGDLGGGAGRFGGPMAVAVGRANGASTPDVYVADAHSRRIVHLRHQGSHLTWTGAVPSEADVVTSLDVDQWGNLYAAAPRQGLVRKYSPSLAPVAELADGVTSPRNFHVPFFNVRDHRTNQVARVGQPNGLSLDRWTDDSGLSLWKLGVDMRDVSVAEGGAPSARFTLTDRADVTVEILDAAGGVIARRASGALDAGLHTLALDGDLAGAARNGGRTLRLVARSSYPEGPTVSSQTALAGGGSVTLPSRPSLIGNTPNPAPSSTRIAFMLPAGSTDRAGLRVYDPLGRVVRTFHGGFTTGRNEVFWDGLDEAGTPVPAGVYFYSLNVDREEFTRKLVLVR